MKISSRRWELSWKSCKFVVDEPCQIWPKLHFEHQLMFVLQCRELAVDVKPSTLLQWTQPPLTHVYVNNIVVLHSTRPHKDLALLVSLFEIFLLVPMIVLAFTIRICSNVLFQCKCYECYAWVQLDAYINFYHFMSCAVNSICNE